MRTCSCMCVRLYVRAYVWVWMCKRSCVCTRAHSCVCVCVNLCMSVCLCVSVFTYARFERLPTLIFYFILYVARVHSCVHVRGRKQERISNTSKKSQTLPILTKERGANDEAIKLFSGVISLPSINHTWRALWLCTSWHPSQGLPPHPTPFKNKKNNNQVCSNTPLAPKSLHFRNKFNENR